MSIKKDRQISLDYLRILSMLMIIILHFFSYSSFGELSKDLSDIYIYKNIICSFCLVSVNCFVLISGYFCMMSSFKLKKLISLALETLFYSVIIYFLCIYTNQITFSYKELFYNFFPTLTRQYWFMTTYVGIYILSPIIKAISKKISRKEHIGMLVVGFLLFVLYYNFFFFCDNLNFGGATGIVWFSYLYFCGTYIYQYYKPDYNLKKHVKIFFKSQTVALLTYIPFIIMFFLSDNKIFIKGANVFNSVYNSLFVFINSILFFLIFLNIKSSNKHSNEYINVIKFLSSSSLSVYLIHENRYIRNLLWNCEIFGLYDDIFYCVVLSIMVPIVIYVFCCLIDQVRLFIFNRIFNVNKIWIKIDNLQSKIQSKLNNVYDKVMNKNEIKN